MCDLKYLSHPPVSSPHCLNSNGSLYSPSLPLSFQPLPFPESHQFWCDLVSRKVAPGCGLQWYHCPSPPSLLPPGPLSHHLLLPSPPLQALFNHSIKVSLVRIEELDIHTPISISLSLFYACSTHNLYADPKIFHEKKSLDFNRDWTHTCATAYEFEFGLMTGVSRWQHRYPG